MLSKAAKTVVFFKKCHWDNKQFVKDMLDVSTVLRNW